MSEQVKPGDSGVIARGLLVLAAIVVIGVGVAEHQLNTLTQRPEQERFFYIGRDQEHVYSAYVLGHGLSLGNLYPLCTISRTDHTVVLRFDKYALVVPARVEINGVQVLHWLDIWRQQFVEEAFAVKKKIMEYWIELKPYIKANVQTLKAEVQSIIQQITD
ncbi:hypothetical protein [Sporomusa aerivorans]|uniref:hypothetical protein n=1 Tax=Sporomusa aerivorans TaxID=204936 RepID=UPI00352BAD8C